MNGKQTNTFQLGDRVTFHHEWLAAYLWCSMHAGEGRKGEIIDIRDDQFARVYWDDGETFWLPFDKLERLQHEGANND